MPPSKWKNQEVGFEYLHDRDPSISSSLPPSPLPLTIDSIAVALNISGPGGSPSPIQELGIQRTSVVSIGGNNGPNQPLLEQKQAHKFLGVCVCVCVCVCAVVEQLNPSDMKMHRYSHDSSLLDSAILLL